MWITFGFVSVFEYGTITLEMYLHHTQMLTKKQKNILDYIENFIQENDYSPSLEEIKNNFQLSSIATVHEHVKNLKEKGYLNKNASQQRAIKISRKENLVRIPLLGTIAAGQPLTLFNVAKETIAIPKSKLPRSSEIYALRVIGNSMIDENINDGDIVLVKHQATAENGQKVVALIDNDSATLKKFYKEKGHIRLQPANKGMEPIIIRKDRDFAIQGIVIDVIHEEINTIIQLPKQEEVQKYTELPLNNNNNSLFASLTSNRPSILIFSSNSSSLLPPSSCISLLLPLFKLLLNSSLSLFTQSLLLLFNTNSSLKSNPPISLPLCKLLYSSLSLLILSLLLFSLLQLIE